VQPTNSLQVVIAAVNALDAKVDRDVLLEAAEKDDSPSVKGVVFVKLTAAQDSDVLPFIFASAKSTDVDEVAAAISALTNVTASPETRVALTRVLTLQDNNLIRMGLRVLREKPDPEMKSVVAKVAENAALPNNIRDTAKRLLSL